MSRNDARYLRCTAALGAAFFACGAAAAELTSPPVAPATEGVAAGLSPWQIRVRGLGVLTEDSGSINGVPGSDLSYSDSLIPELDISYFFTDNIAAELILGTTYANIKEVGAVGVPVGKAWLLPPTLRCSTISPTSAPSSPISARGSTTRCSTTRAKRRGSMTSTSTIMWALRCRSVSTTWSTSIGA